MTLAPRHGQRPAVPARGPRPPGQSHQEAEGNIKVAQGRAPGDEDVRRVFERGPPRALHAALRVGPAGTRAGLLGHRHGEGLCTS